MNVIIASLLLIATSLSGCITEELVDDILGCMDENAANYEENATSELLGDCIYMATAETFMEAMTDVGSIEDILEDTPKAGYSQSISSSEWNQDLGMQMDVEIEDIVMADLNANSVYVHNLHKKKNGERQPLHVSITNIFICYLPIFIFYY